MRLILLFLFVPAFFILLSSCKKSKTAQPAFFLRASEVSVSTTSKQGSGSHKITDLWLYVNGKFQGAYPVGGLMPVISNNQAVKIDVFAGIKNNGIAGTRIFWQLYDLWKLDTLVESGKTVDLKMKFRYNPGTTFAWTENFEGGSSGYTIQKSAISSTNFRITDAANSFEGRSIELGLSGDSIVAQIESSSLISLPKASSNVYLELNYKGNHDFLVGLRGEDGTEKEALYVKAQEQWGKIYIQLAEALNTPPVSEKNKVYFRLIKKDVPEPKIYLDNIKLIYL